jgi:UDP-2,3-diacylglucosamine pyrophosphatase LpxH
MRHHKPSVTDLRLQEEKATFRSELSLLEPRPQSMMIMGGIFEVLEGRA